MPLDQAVYVPATGSRPEFIAAVRGGIIYKCDATSGNQLSRSQYDPYGMGPGTICYVPTEDKIFATCYNNPVVELVGPDAGMINHKRYVYFIEPSTLSSSVLIDVQAWFDVGGWGSYGQVTMGVRQLFYKNEKVYLSACVSAGDALANIASMDPSNPYFNSYDWGYLSTGMGPTDIDVDMYENPTGVKRIIVPGNFFNPSSITNSDASGSFARLNGTSVTLIGTGSNITGSALGFPNFSASFFTGSLSEFTGTVAITLPVGQTNFSGFLTGFNGYMYFRNGLLTTYGPREIVWAADQETGLLWGCDMQNSWALYGTIDTIIRTHDPQGIATDGSGSVWYSEIGPWIFRFDSTNASSFYGASYHTCSFVLSSSIGRPNFHGYHMRYNQYDGKVYAAGYSDNTIAIVEPSDNSIVVKTGFDLPLDIVFTPTKQFAVQHGSVGLKEII